ncbi:MAG: hypothetical protein RIK87_25365 [Fuerstiella sp.]
MAGWLAAAGRLAADWLAADWLAAMNLNPLVLHFVALNLARLAAVTGFSSRCHCKARSNGEEKEMSHQSVPSCVQLNIKNSGSRQPDAEIPRKKPRSFSREPEISAP